MQKLKDLKDKIIDKLILIYININLTPYSFKRKNKDVVLSLDSINQNTSSKIK